MKQLNYRKFYKIDHWGSFGKDVAMKLRSESALITTIPAGGKRFFLKHIKEYYSLITKDEDTIIISFEILPKQLEVTQISIKIIELINYKLKFPRYLQDLSCESTLKELINQNKKILIIINRFERLKDREDVQTFIESLRIIDQFKIRFLIGCDISALTNPELYKSSGVLFSSNMKVIPTFTRKQIEISQKIHEGIHGWKIPKKFQNEIYSLSGGNPGLVKYIIKHIYENKVKRLRTENLLEDPSINLKITNIYNKLNECELIKDNKLNLQKEKVLKKLRILDENNEIRIKLLETLLTTSRKLIPNGKLQKIMSKQELELFNVFDSHFDEILNLDQIASLLWEDKVNEKFSLWSIYKVISNLNTKLDKYGLKIKNYRGRGYALTNK